jgi:hypothetical protein
MTDSTPGPVPARKSGVRAGWQDRLIAIIIIALTVYFWIKSVEISAAEARMFPRMILSIMGLLSLLLFIRSFRIPQDKRADAVFTSVPAFTLFVLTTAVYVVSVAYLGYFTSSAVYVPLVAYLIGLRKHWTSLIVTTVFLGATYLVFVVLFARPLPTEIFAG